MVEEAKSWIKDNSTLIYFLIAQFIAIGAGAASILAYAVKLETRVHIMEHRGADNSPENGRPRNCASRRWRARSSATSRASTGLLIR